MEISFLGMDVTIPDDPIAFIKTKAIELLNHLGYEWPTTKEDVLDQWAELWGNAPQRLQTYIDQYQGAINHIRSNNTGPGADSFVTYLGSDQANMATLVSIRDAAGVASASYSGAALLVRGLRAYVIGKLLLDAVMLAAAIISGGASAQRSPSRSTKQSMLCWVGDDGKRSNQGRFENRPGFCGEADRQRQKIRR